jgi:hypothetical protein
VVPLRRRQFSQVSQLLLVSHSTPRPQLPFLPPLAAFRNGQPHIRNGQLQLSRLISTENKLYVKDVVRLSVKFTFATWFAIMCIGTMYFGVLQEYTMRMNPPPPEWLWTTKNTWCGGKRAEEPIHEQIDFVAFNNVYRQYEETLRRLESPEYDGQKLKQVEEGGILVEGVGEMGYDITDYDYPWRQGYYTVLLALAQSAEKLDGWVLDSKRKIWFQKEYIIGTYKGVENPYPTPPPAGTPENPLAEDCVDGHLQPETFYMKILSTKGFTSGEKVRAALSYADYLNFFKKTPETALEMLNWAMDIATASQPDIVDRKTGIIKAEAELVPTNILETCNALAVYHASNNNLPQALNIFLSVLRARRRLPSYQEPPAPVQGPPSMGGGYVLDLFKKVAFAPAYPPPNPTGEEIPLRTPKNLCIEAGIMANIGEIMFALDQRETGITWTREAVDVAEENFFSARRQRKIDDGNGFQGMVKCKECLDVGMGNWQLMLNKLLTEEEAKKEAQGEKGEKKGWLGSVWGQKEEQTGRWEAELQVWGSRKWRQQDIKAKKGRFTIHPFGEMGWFTS